MKTFVLIVSRVFPATHKRKGEKTYFSEKIISAIHGVDKFRSFSEKPHTIRKNYPLWKKRIIQIQEGKAVLKVCFWRDPRGRFLKGNKLVEICQLDKDSGIGVQKLDRTALGWFVDEYDSDVTTKNFAKNDGLSIEDFKEWFKNYDLSESLAIIHFTNFRY